MAFLHGMLVMQMAVLRVIEISPPVTFLAAPENKMARSLHLHVTALHVKALTTVRVHEWLWWGREYQLRISRSCRRSLVVSSNVYTICVIAPNKRGRSVSIWRLGCNSSAFIDRTTDRSSRSTNWRTSGSVKSFATKWLNFVARMLLYRVRLRNWLGTRRISWRLLNVAVVFAQRRDLVVMVRAETTNIKRMMRTHPARQLDRVLIAFPM
uniref:RxLR effector candidate protein n=1 Tax=Hyaloperonospora arabidopsidis (strain Emoy2) TaxID=559515 RepID=M4C1E2_HYAAE